MESLYPEDLRNELHPLVFVVSAISDTDNSGNGGKPIFDRFVEAISSSLTFNSDSVSATETNIDCDDTTIGTSASTVSAQSKQIASRNVSLFRADDDDDDDNSSDEEDELLLESFVNGPIRKKSGHGFGFGRRNTGRNTSVVDPNYSLDPSHYNSTVNTSFARTLKVGKTFFQNARIVNISTRYGFPPSKDPEGTQNLAFDLNNILKQPLRRSGGSVAVTAAVAEREQVLHTLFRTYPMAGIIPTVWLAKHVHALPSAIIVVCTITSSQKDQAEQDRRLFETIEHLQYSIVPKRQCGIQVVGLMKDDLSDEQGAEWSRSVSQDLLLEDNLTTPFTVTLLRLNATLNEKDSSKDSKEALYKLHGSVRDASLQYYRQQARRTKDKLRRLTDDQRKNGPPEMQLSPLVIRYCFKIAIFYEFQMCYEKSFRFLMEAYRTVTKYYLWLLEAKSSNRPSQPIDSVGKLNDASINISPSMSSPTLERPTTSALPVSATNFEAGEVVEVELAPETIERGYASFIPPPPDDAMHQCREVADWLNFKVLSMSLSSNTEAGLLAAGGQWRQHSRIFSTLQYTSKLPNTETWFVWVYICRQRIIMSLLTEKYPPKVSGELSHHINEALIRCSPWRCYMSAAEAILNLAQEVEKVKTHHSIAAQTVVGEKGDTSGSRARYVGSLYSDTMRLEFSKECSVTHREKALDFMLRSIRLFENELINSKRGFYAEDASTERTSSRSGARLYYIAGGLLVGMDKHKDAGLHLMKASRLCRGWRDLELPVRRLLIECYEHCIPSQNDASNESSENVVSTILYSYFNAELSSLNLRNALSHLSSVSGGKALHWYLETCDEEDTSLPFSFAVSFPGKTQARSGDTVAASVTVKSNLNYAVYVNSVAIGTLAGKLVIPPNDLLSAANASDGSDGGIIIQANAAILITTKVKLPKDLSAIAFDESGNGGELLGVAGKGSFAKIAKPRTAGITAAGGARLVSEQLLQRGNNESQGWNVRFLGGKPLLCDGLHLTFYPVQAEAASSSRLTPIELKIQKKKIKTAANIKRTPFEEENYIASAWSRPQHLPFSRGPRSIRVLGPQPELIVTNMTEQATKGKALEGTVNRFLLKLQSGSEENCTDLKINVSCFSVLITPSGTTKRLVSNEEILRGSENSLDMANSNYRTPSLVKPSNEGTSTQSNCFGYNLPVGWVLAGTGQQYSDKCDDLKAGDHNFVQLDVYRPAAYCQKTLLSDDGTNSEDNIGDVSLCKTDFYVSLEYKQERLSIEKQSQRRPKRATRARPVMSSNVRDNTTVSEDDQSPSQNTSPEDTDTCDIVSLEWSGSILWAPPITATFSRGALSGYPCGSRHPSQHVDNTIASSSKEIDFFLTDGEKFSTRCSLQLDTSMDSIHTEIVAVRFEGNKTADNPVSATLIVNKDTTESDCVYRPRPDDPSRMLSTGSRLSVSYTILASLKEDALSSAFATLGSILVDWRPSKLELLVEPSILKDKLGVSRSHGPLALETPSTIRFTGPNCYIERAPFKAETLDLPPHVSVATPFDVRYSIVNTTSSHQSVSIQILEESALSDTSTTSSSGLMLSGCMKGQLSLGPLERHTLSYRAIAFYPGEVPLPILRISSDRYKSWIVNERSAGKRIYVLP